MKKHALLIALSATIVSPAFGWEIHQFKSRPERTEILAELRSVGATLYVGCINGEAMPVLEFDMRIGSAGIDVSYRLDDGPIIRRNAGVSQDGRYLWIWQLDANEAVERLRNARRLRVSLRDITVDFDLSKGHRELPNFRCAPFPV
ncbi:hypothetical protein [Bradyrhizobium valentinum]|uniref:Uncharacterized protein n=1 Tax=Bradyrhizobium valentinum TaxID=1518501 RepID=A0A0R3KWK8_9BRAD|nr:hypothetical protein [Bradyrhizobium valentinum]KRR00025.1 hypothetical protein CQ10_24165 [Bradyrhizobium valentinum]KRR02145.1 hypothetical protein CP49_05090 [Bradyrhizobium valentinum]